MSVEYQNSILWRGEDPLKKKFKGKVDKTAKVTRYFPGKQPKWISEEDKKEQAKEEALDRAEALRHNNKRKKTAPVILEDGPKNSRLARLQAQASQQAPEDVSERVSRHRRVHEVARILEEERADKEDVKDEDAKGFKKEEMKEEPLIGDVKEEDDAPADNELRSLRRDMARQVALLKSKQQEDLLKHDLGGDEEEEDDEEESEEESEDDGPGSTMLKPVFVRKAQRETVAEKEKLKKEEEEALKQEEEKKVQQKVESKELLVDQIRMDEEADNQIGANDGSDVELIDDDDEKNEAEEYELWKIRELKRIKRDKQERLVRQKEIDFIIKRRNMTEEERLADDKKLDDEANKRDDVKGFGFLQKYYHRGGFFQDKAVEGSEPLYLRDYHEPLEEEKFDKQLLPKAMQLRRGQFGKKGQVKHTHLTESDTTDMSAAWSKHTKQIERYQERMATASGVNAFDRPAGSSRGSAQR